MLVYIYLEYTDVSLRANNKQGQAAKDGKMLIFRIFLLQSLRDAHRATDSVDTLICQVFITLEQKNRARYSAELGILQLPSSRTQLLVHHTCLKVSKQQC